MGLAQGNGRIIFLWSSRQLLGRWNRTRFDHRAAFCANLRVVIQRTIRRNVDPFEIAAVVVTHKCFQVAPRFCLESFYNKRQPHIFFTRNLLIAWLVSLCNAARIFTGSQVVRFVYHPSLLENLGDPPGRPPIPVRIFPPNHSLIVCAVL